MIVDLPNTARSLRHWTDSQPSALEAMAKFTLKERPGTGIEVPDPNPPSPQTKPPNNVGDQILFIDRQLEDKKGNLVGTLVSRCTIVQRFAQDDVVVAFTATNKLNKGMINTQGVPGSTTSPCRMA